MPVLLNSRHEQFAANVAEGMAAGPAYAKSGYSKNGCDVSASQLLRNPKVRSRLAELRAAITRSNVHLAITDREVRLEDYNQIRSKLLQVMRERAAHPDFQNTPGGKTGTLVKTLKQVGSGRNSQLLEEFSVDTALLRELRETHKQAAIELSQWSEKKEVTGKDGGPITIAQYDAWLVEEDDK